MVGKVARWLDRFSAQPRDESRPRADLECAPLKDATARERIDVHGVLRSVALRPVDDVTSLEAELDDGTGSVTLIWLGRRQIRGIAQGRSLTASGRVGHRGDKRVMYNPAYRLDA